MKTPGVPLEQLASEMVYEDEAFIERLRDAGLTEDEIRSAMKRVEAAAMTAAKNFSRSRDCDRSELIEKLATKIRALKKKALSGRLRRIK